MQLAESSATGPISLFSEEEARDFHKRWERVQTEFVDEPRGSVEKADQLVASTIKRLADVFPNEKTRLEEEGAKGDNVSTEDGQKAARACAVNLLAQIKAALGDLDKVVRVVRLGGFINSAPTFLDGPKVMNGASDLMVAVFGDKGRHARTTVGVAVLPADAAVEVEGTFEVS